MEVIISNHRNGPVGTTNLVLRSKFSSFNDMGDEISRGAPFLNRHCATAPVSQ